MSAMEEWARRELQAQNFERMCRTREMNRRVKKEAQYNAMTWWQKVKHNCGFGDTQ